jgi:hypothetical protein
MTINNNTEEIMCNQIRRVFSALKYQCETQKNIESITGFSVVVDVFCRKSNDIVIAKIVTAHFNFDFVKRFKALRLIPKLSTAQLYIAVPKTFDFSQEERFMMIINNIRICRVDTDAASTSPIELEIPRSKQAERFSPGVEMPVDDLTEISQESAFLLQRNIPIFFSDQLHFNSLAYQHELNQFVRTYAGVKNENDETEQILKMLDTLWSGKYQKAEIGNSFQNFKDFEQVLKSIRGYRDHFVHPFQVFLLGSLIIEKHYGLFFDLTRSNLRNAETDLSFSWLLASTFHDFCYPIQGFNDFTQKFFPKFLGTNAINVELDLKNLLTDGESLTYLDQLVSLFSYNKRSEKTGWIFANNCNVDHKLQKLFLNQIITWKDHGVLSALTLLKKIQKEEYVKKNKRKYNKTTFSTDVFPASLAIALHNTAIYCKDSEICELPFERYPLAFLLIYCDTVQEWGRPSNDTKPPMSFIDLTITDNEITTKLLALTRAHFDEKVNKYKNAFRKLTSQSLSFSVLLRCEEDGKEEPITIAPKK